MEMPAIGLKQRLLGIRCRAQWKTLLAIVTFFRGNFRDKADLFVDPPVDKSQGMLLDHFGTVSHTQTTMNAKRGVLFKPVFIRAILIGQLRQLGGIRGMGHQQLNNGLADSV